MKNCPFRVGNGYDVHVIQQGLTMYLGGIKIDGDRGFLAHSDGDVAIHALCDAILGALALGDIGKHFPDNSNDWKNCDSKKLLAIVCELMDKEGYALGNADITIALQSPKIAKYVPEMRACLAAILKTDISSVSIKATTTEKLGFVGREEGCQVWATCLLYKKYE